MRRLLIILALCMACQVHAQESQKLRFRMVSADGKGIPAAEIREFIARDLNDEPIVTTIAPHDGYVTIVLPGKPVEVSALFKVPGFGEVVVFADNDGKGYTQPGTVDFVTEAAKTRIHRVRSAFPASLTGRLNRAEKKPPYESLAISLAVGEELTVLRAQNRIRQLKGPRTGFLFGCNSMGHPARGPLYDERFKAIFNWGTPNLYLTHYAPTETTRDYSRTDIETDWLVSFGAKVKPCPAFYLAGGVTPQWLKDLPYSEVRKFAHDLIKTTCERYAGRAKFCEIINEADMSNGLRLTNDELVDLARVTSQAAREGDPNALRIINSAHLWGDYAVRPGKRSPYRYLQDCMKAGVEFEITGLQMYYPEYDLFEIDRMLEKYAKLGKPILITEMGCSSAPGIDPNAQRKKATAGWHGPWTEEMQADWVEGIYTLAYSKPYCQGVGWWDMADAVSFWPYGGLCRGDMSPKPAYLRLMALEKKWGLR
jgi:endo-1,4-beta-xylanase